MKIVMFLFIAFSLFFSFGCSERNSVEPENKKYNFAIYFLKDTTLRIQDIMNSNSYPFITNLEDLELANRPWITQDDIDFYEWSTHNIYLKKDKSQFFPGNLDFFYQFPVSWTEKPWVVVANGIPCYVGYFTNLTTSDFIPFPYINVLHVGAFPPDILPSEWNFLIKKDIRDNDLVQQALIQCGLYRGGLEVSIDTTGTPVKVYADTTVEYTLKFKNNDSDNIYFYDPYKVDRKIYAYYSYRIYFYNIATGEYYYGQDKDSKSPGLHAPFDNTCYTLLNSGESVKRTFRVKTYPDNIFVNSQCIIPIGTYLVQTGYGTPVFSLTKDVRVTQQGRYVVYRGGASTDPIPVIITAI